MRRLLRVFGVVLVIGGLVTAGYVLFQLYAPSTTDKDNEQVAEDILKDWSQAAAVPTKPKVEPDVVTGRKPSLPSGGEPSFESGKAFGVIRIPAIKVTSPVAQGTGAGVLSKGIGHFPQSVAPGEVGNFATAGHVCCRASGQPYKKLHQLKTGDQIFVETKKATYTYKVVEMPQCDAAGTKGPGNHTLVTPEHVEVVNPDPCTESQPTRKLMTLTTCYPDRSIVDLENLPAPYRLVVWAELEKVQERA